MLAALSDAVTSGWEEAAAVGTIAAAFATTWLALATRKLAREAGAETRANWRPVLMFDASAQDDGTSDTLRFDEDGRLLADVVNVGRGPALMVTVYLELGEKDEAGFEKIARGRAIRDVVAPDGHLTLRWRDFTLPEPSPSRLGWSSLKGMMTYADVGYRRYETEFNLGFRIDNAVALLDQRYLGAYADRVGRRKRLEWKWLTVILRVEPHLPRPLRKLARRMIRVP